MREPSDYSATFADLLREVGADVVLAGALAANAWRREPRFTTDVDFLARSLVGVADALEARGFEVKAMAEPGGDPYLLFVRGDGIRVDILLAETEYHEGAMDRAIDGRLSAEDVIVHKLIAWRAKDRDDVEAILAAGHPLDEEYVERWAAAWEVSDRWAEATHLWR